MIGVLLVSFRGQGGEVSPPALGVPPLDNMAYIYVYFTFVPALYQM